MGIVLTLVGACILGPDGYTDYNGQRQEWLRKHYLIDVTTDPPGAPVNFDGEFVGRSPLKHLVPRSQVSPIGIRIEALPFQGGQFGQTTLLEVAKRDWTQPIKVFFNMRMDRVAPTQRFESR